MSYADLPNELRFQIILEAVKVRSLKRALRLMTVCQFYRDMVPEAIFESGLVEKTSLHPRRAGLDFYRSFLEHKCSRVSKTSPQFVWTIRQLAEALLRHENRYCEGITEPAIMYYVRMISILPVEGCVLNRHLRLEREGKELRGKFPEDSVAFKRMLLGAAAHVGNRALVEELISKGNNFCSTFVPPRGHESMDFPNPLQSAALSGKDDIIELLLTYTSTYAPMYDTTRVSICMFAARTGHISSIEIGLQKKRIGQEDSLPSPASLGRIVRDILTNMTSEQVFVSYHGYWSQMQPPDWPYKRYNRTSKWFNNKVSLQKDMVLKASKGLLGIVKYLVEFGAPLDGDAIKNSSRPCTFRGLKDCTHPIAHAAGNGHAHVVRYLLESGAQPSHAFETACSVGSMEIVQLLMDYKQRPTDPSVMRLGLVNALARENGPLVQHLIQAGIPFDEETWNYAIDRTPDDGSQFMRRFIEEQTYAGPM